MELFWSIFGQTGKVYSPLFSEGSSTRFLPGRHLGSCWVCTSFWFSPISEPPSPRRRLVPRSFWGTLPGPSDRSPRGSEFSRETWLRTEKANNHLDQECNQRDPSVVLGMILRSNVPYTTTNVRGTGNDYRLRWSSLSYSFSIEKDCSAKDCDTRISVI